MSHVLQSDQSQPVQCGVIEIKWPLALGIRNNVSFILMSCRHPVMSRCSVYLYNISTTLPSDYRTAAPSHGPHRGPGRDQRQGGEGRPSHGLPRPPSQRN